METEKPYVIGMDLGGTNSVCGIVDARGNILCTDSVKTQQYPNIEDYIQAVCNILMPMIEKVGGMEKIKGFGIGAPNGNYYNGTIEHAPNLPWKGIVPMANMFKTILGIPVALTNDANAAAIGEMTYGAARGYGCDGFAGELGHVIMRREDGRLCGCGRKGCLETYCSATGVARTAREILTKDSTPSLLRDLNPEEITSKDVYDAAVKGDAIALKIFDFTGKILGEALADFAAFSSPEAFIFFGGLTKSGKYIMDPIKDSYNENVMPIFKGKAKMLVSELKDSDAAVLGASALGWEAK